MFPLPSEELKQETATAINKGSAPASIIAAVRKHRCQKQVGAGGGGGSSFVSHFHITVHHGRKADRKLEAGAVTEDLLLTACSACFLMEPGTTRLVMVTPIKLGAYPFISH